MIVVGAGMAGLLAAGMLRGDVSEVWDQSPSLPNNHSAVLRFRSPIIGEALNIPFQPVRTIKAVDPWINPIADAMSYSIKTNGTATLRSILQAKEEPVTRYIAPPDMIKRMADRVEAVFCFGCSLRKPNLYFNRPPMISTIPMPELMYLMGYEEESRIQFRHVGGTNIGVKIPGVSAHCSLYVPDPQCPFSRVTLTGDELVAECYGEVVDDFDDDDPLRIIHWAMSLLGLGPLLDHFSPKDALWVRKQAYAKILPIDEDERRKFIMWASDRGVYSLGRFATWRPGLLLDDLVNDVRVIQKLIDSKGERYAHRLKGK